MRRFIIVLIAVLTCTGSPHFAAAQQRSPRIVTTDLVIITITRGPIPADLKRHALSARLRIAINPDGSVQKVTVVKSSGHVALDAYAVEQFSTWNFRGRGCDVAFVPLTIDIPRGRGAK
jgi:TonB family protein